ncbi:MAG: substrate-binding domain-containing protein [Verrucomicrobiota bacterium]|nr:substrate-binding domain-containing protein [Verrucomicrobiota bacterium]
MVVLSSTYGMTIKEKWLLLGILLMLLVGCGFKGESLTIYTSQDQVYAEPILREFENQSGIRIRAVYDSEAVKTVGLVNRLIVEKDNPQCDLFWNNEELRTRQLAAKGVLDKDIGIEVFGARTRQWVWNTNQLSLTSIPKNLTTLTNVQWRGKVAIALPLFGSTSTHFQILRQQWGKERWQQWCRALVANDVMTVDGNSVVVQLVGRGEVALGLTDSDDVRAGLKNQLPIAGKSIIEDGFVIRNSVGYIAGSAFPNLAQRLAAFLKSDSVKVTLIDAGALDSSSSGFGQEIDWPSMVAENEVAINELKSVFLD